MCESEIDHQWRYVKQVDGDTTYETPYTEMIVERAEAIIIKRVDEFIKNNERITMCLIRPPSHHSCCGLKVGFCHKNLVISALDMFHNRGKNVVILDIDAHHGDGTEKEIMKRDYGYYISIHGYGENVYPFTGAEECNDKLLNVPLDKTSSDEAWLGKMCSVILPKIKEINPDYIILSCGFDGYYKDISSPLQLTEKSYKVFAAEFEKLKISVFVVLEGGYYIPILGELTTLILTPFTC